MLTCDIRPKRPLLSARATVRFETEPGRRGLAARRWGLVGGPSPLPYLGLATSLLCKEFGACSPLVSTGCAPGPELPSDGCKMFQHSVNACIGIKGPVLSAKGEPTSVLNGLGHTTHELLGSSAVRLLVARQVTTDRSSHLCTVIEGGVRSPALFMAAIRGATAVRSRTHKGSSPFAAGVKNRGVFVISLYITWYVIL